FINSPLQVTTPSLPVGGVGTSYSATLMATGGAPPYKWGTTGGALPTGLQLNSLTGTIAGTPTQTGNFSFTVKVQDTVETSSSTLSLVISSDPSPTISTIAPTTGFAGGETPVTISGTNFRPGVEIKFGNDAATFVQIVNPGMVKVITPPGPVGVVTVTLQDSDGLIANA